MHTTNFFKTFEILTPRLEKIMEHLCMQCTVSDEPDVLVREGDPDRLFQDFARHQGAGDAVMKLFMHMSKR